MGEEILTEEETADRLRVAAGTLRAYRYKGTGPAYVRLGKGVRYRWSDVETWLDARTVND